MEKTESDSGCFQEPRLPSPQERHSRNFSVPGSRLPDDTRIKVFMSLTELVKGIPRENLHAEVALDGPVGKAACIARGFDG